MTGFAPPTALTDSMDNDNASLRSSSKGLLTVTTIKSNQLVWAFSRYDSALWNSLPRELRSATTTCCLLKANEKHLNYIHLHFLQALSEVWLTVKTFYIRINIIIIIPFFNNNNNFLI